MIPEQPRLVIEHDELSELVEDLKRLFDVIAVMPDGRRLVLQAKVGNQADEAVARAEIEKTALSNKELDELIDRHPVPAEWGNELGSSYALPPQDRPEQAQRGQMQLAGAKRSR